MASNPSVLQPGLLPLVTSLRPSQYKPASYSQRLRKPRGFLLFETRKSLSSAMIAAAVCKKELSRAHENGQMVEGSKTHVRREAGATHPKGIVFIVDGVILRLQGNVRDTAAHSAA